MGYPGVELTWKPATDNNWISYYEVFRDGMAIDRVAKGLYYFDHSAGADLAAKYEVRAVDGAGNVSPLALADGPAAKRSRVDRRRTGRGRRLYRFVALGERFPARVLRERSPPRNRRGPPPASPSAANECSGSANSAPTPVRPRSAWTAGRRRSSIPIPPTTSGGSAYFAKSLPPRASTHFG